MKANLNAYKEALDKLIEQGERLHFAMQYECRPEEFEEAAEQIEDKELKKKLKKLSNFSENYQSWYSEVKALVKQLLPDRLDDLVRHYQKPKPRKDISFESYRIEDYLQGLVIRSYGDIKVDTSAAIPHFRQQLAILKSVKSRLESSLFDIKQLVQADLFDSELEAAGELLKKGFLRGAGAVAGVVLERHLKEVCARHNLSSRRKRPSISDFNDLLKSNDVIEVPDWRRVQRMGDLRNLCDHSKDREPLKEEIEELLSGVGWATHTIF